MANLLILMTFWWKFIYDVIIVYASFYSFNFLIQNDVCKRESTTVQSFSNVGISCIITKTRMWRNPPSRQTRRFAMIRIDLCMYFREKVLLDSSFFIFFIDVFLDSILKSTMPTAILIQKFLLPIQIWIQNILKYRIFEILYVIYLLNDKFKITYTLFYHLINNKTYKFEYKKI